MLFLLMLYYADRLMIMMLMATMESAAKVIENEASVHLSIRFASIFY